MTLRIVVCRNREALALAGARAIAARIDAVLARRRLCDVALAGGGTPRPVYERLAAGTGLPAIDWSRVRLFFGDERCVPPEDPESNYGMARASLLERLPVEPAAVLRMAGERCPEAAEEYDRLLPERFDLLLLGMGADGHVASLFPGSPALAEKERRCVAVSAPKPPAARLTITPPVIERAEEIVLLVAGRSKAPALAAVARGDRDPARLPAMLARRGLFVVDREAAAELPAGTGSGAGEDGGAR